MVVGEEPAAGSPRYAGYRFDPADLPNEYRAQERWREYLFRHAVPGRIVDETAYVRHLLAAGARDYYEKRAECGTPLESRLPPPEQRNPHAWYSFNPDDPRPGQEPCYNCVKWAIEVANGLVASFLPPVPQGRLKRALEHLEKRRA
jgi:hypothetical protein